MRAAGLVNPECSAAVGVPPSHGPSEGGVDPRLVQVGERSQRATHNPPRGPAPDVRDCRIRHGGWLLVLCLTSDLRNEDSKEIPEIISFFLARNLPNLRQESPCHVPRPAQESLMFV